MVNFERSRRLNGRKHPALCVMLLPWTEVNVCLQYSCQTRSGSKTHIRSTFTFKSSSKLSGAFPARQPEVEDHTAYHSKAGAAASELTSHLNWWFDVALPLFPPKSHISDEGSCSPLHIWTDAELYSRCAEGPMGTR
ncbi:hypothetical protein NQZ68_023022 [Dissostichus eleginoides]|nr:hypothetical protein NQZ68_023022 [Dissostichus eleginoides]